MSAGADLDMDVIDVPLRVCQADTPRRADPRMIASAHVVRT